MNAILQTIIIDAIGGAFIISAVCFVVVWVLWLIGLFDLEDGQ